MNVFLWNARARNGHVEATLNHPFPAQVPVRELAASRFKNHPRPAQVGDFVSNATARTRWTNVAVEADGRSGAAAPASCGAWERANACGDEASLECFSHEMACSHGGQTRAFEGFAGSGRGRKRVRNSQLQRLLSRPFSTRFG